MKHPGSAILVLALWLGACAEVRAEPAPALAIEIHESVPFDRAELEAALLPRLDDASAETRAAAYSARVQVSAGDGGVLVRAGARQRTVPLGERSGAAAARVVALVILDLVLSEGPSLPMPLEAPVADETPEASAGPVEVAAAPATPAPASAAPATPAPVAAASIMMVPSGLTNLLAFTAPPPPPPPPVPRPDAAPALQVAPRPTPARPDAPFLVRLSGLGGAMLGADGDGSMLAAGADVRLGLGRWRAGAGLAWVRLPTHSYERTDIGLNGAVLRLDAGRALGGVEVTATAFAMPSRLRTDSIGSPRDQHDRLLFGGGAAVRAGAGVAPGWRLEATAGIDVFGRRLRVRTPGEVLTSTPLLTISLAVGLSWEAAP
jgi:hypothetical protein